MIVIKSYYSRILNVTDIEFDNLAGELRPQIVAQARRLLGDGDGAEDCAQDCLVKLWTMRNQLDGMRSVRALAMVICRNQCLDVLKRPSRRSSSIEDIDFSVPESRIPDRELEMRDDCMAAVEMMDQLPPNVKMAMKMRHIQGMEINEIAEAAGVSVENVRVSISRGRKRLRELFEKRI